MEAPGVLQRNQRATSNSRLTARPAGTEPATSLSALTAAHVCGTGGQVYGLGTTYLDFPYFL